MLAMLVGALAQVEFDYLQWLLYQPLQQVADLLDLQSSSMSYILLALLLLTLFTLKSWFLVVIELSAW